MRKFLALCLFIVAASVMYADGYVRVVKRIPPAASGTNAVVSVRFGDSTRAVEPVAFDISGATASSGQVSAYQIRDLGGTLTTNTVKAAADCAATNAISVASFKGYCYGNEPLYFKFTLATGGYLTVYGKVKE